LSGFGVFDLSVASGRLALSPMPGVHGAFSEDLRQIIDWAPDHVLSLTEASEMASCGATDLGPALTARGIRWHHAPIVDFGTPARAFLRNWPDVSDRLRTSLSRGGRVLIHCRGGCGRSGMVALRLMIEMGEAPHDALTRLRAVRPCAIETDAQQVWAMAAQRPRL